MATESVPKRANFAGNRVNAPNSRSGSHGKGDPSNVSNAGSRTVTPAASAAAVANQPNLLGLDVALTKSIGAGIKIQLAAPINKTYEGYVYAISSQTNKVMISKTKLSPETGLAIGPFTSLNIAYIQSFEITSLNPPSTIQVSNGIPATRVPTAAFYPKVDLPSQQHIQSTVTNLLNKAAQAEAKVNSAVSSNVQELFDTIGRTMPVRWVGGENNDILISDSVILFKPYGTSNLKVVEGVSEAVGSGTIAMVRRMIEAEARKQKPAEKPVTTNASPRINASTDKITPALPSIPPSAVRKGG